MMARSVEYMVALKNNRVLPNMSCSLPQEVAVLCGSMPQFVGFFAKSAMLVPVPGHHPAKPGSLWVPKVIADSMKQEGLGCSVVRALGRTEAVPQSSKSAPRDRPTVNTHRATLRIRDHIDAEPQDILLVDDVITRGTTIAAAYMRMAEAYPNARIKAFAAMNTIFPDEFRKIMDPRTGTIMLGKSYPEKMFDD